MRSSTMRVTVAFLVFGVFLSGPAWGRRGAAHLFGPTGILGFPTKTTIRVSGAQKGSPAEGKLKKGDEIIGVGGVNFKYPRHDMAKAIDVAETEAAGGKMTLMLKGGKEVVITLEVLGTYSKTAPYDCPKTKKIITMTAEKLISGRYGGRLHPDLLGLMATGEKKYIEAAAKKIQGAAWTKPDKARIDKLIAGEGDMGYVGWDWGYHLITLGEYHLLTGDKSVLPAIETYAMGLARGQDPGGLYGHRMASPKRHGRLPGYGQMNQPSLTCFMGMLFAKKCGIDNPVLEKAIKTTHAYVLTHVGKGSFLYGVHGPNGAAFNNNGTSGSAAVCMDLMKDANAAKFFSQMSAASWDRLEHGHACTFFNGFWTTPGASFSGPEVTQKFFRQSLWYHNLRRNYDGSWSPDSKPGPQEGTALLTYCLPRKVLLITGREADESIYVKGQAAIDVVMANRIGYKAKTPEELMALAMDHYLPQVRRAASAHLGTHREKMAPTWVKYLKEGTPKQKKLAIGQYGSRVPLEERLQRMEEIGAILMNPEEPVDVRVAAALTVAYMGEAAQKYYPHIVKLITLDKPDDPFELSDMQLAHKANVLCSTPFTKGLVPDKDVHYKAALKVTAHKRQHGRGQGLRMLWDMPLEDFHRVADQVMHAIENKDPTYHSYHNPGITVSAAITILANLGIKEGIPLAMGITSMPDGKWSFKMKARWACLAKYGGNAKPQMEQLRKNIEENGRGGLAALGRHRGAFLGMVRVIESDKNPKKLISLEEAIKAGKK